MTPNQAQKLFEEMFQKANQELITFTLSTELKIEQKADKTFVTACDEKIDKVVSQLARDAGLKIVSEEGDKSLQTVRDGNYITIDPIDGTLAYLEYVNYALNHGGIENFLNFDLGFSWDFCILLGLVENGEAMFGGVFNYVTKESFFIDALNNKIIRTGLKRNFEATKAIFVDQRFGGSLETLLKQDQNAKVIILSSFGLRALYACMDFEEAVALHRVQSTGLWDILPAAAMNARIYDEKGDELDLTSYISLPGKGALVLKGTNFDYILEELKKENI